MAYDTAMLPVIYWTCRCLAGIGGTLFLWAAIFLKVDEEAHVKRTIEEWRDRLAVWPTTTKGRRQRWLAISSAISTAALDRVFGRQLLSVRAFVASAAIASFSTVATLLIVGVTAGNFAWYILLALAVLSLVIAAPMVHPGSEKSAGVLLAFLNVWFFNIFFFQTTISRIGLALAFVIVASGILSSYVFIAAVRWAIPRIQTKPTVGRVLLLLLGTVCVVSAVVLLAYTAGGLLAGAVAHNIFRGADESDPFFLLFVWIPFIRGIAFVIASSNMGVMLSGAMVVIVAAALALDSVLWAIFERPVYALARFDVLSRHKLLASVGVALITSATNTGGALIRGAVEFLSRSG